MNHIARHLLRLHFLLFVLFAAVVLSNVARAQEGVDPLVQDRAMARVAPGSTIEDLIEAFQTLHPAVSLSPLDAIPGRPIHLLEIVAPGVSAQQLGAWFESFAGDPTCIWAELLYEGQAPESKTGSTWTDTIGDPAAFSSQFAVDLLGLEQAHRRSTGQGVVVAVLDTGVDLQHPLLAEWIAPGGWDFVRSSQTIEDPHGHGTFVAGLIRLVAPDARLLPVVVLDGQGKGDGWLFGRGLFHAIDSGAKVVNLSLGSTYKAEVVEDALNEAEALGIVVVSAAGNFNRQEPAEYPAAMSSGLGIAATGPDDVKSSFSNYHPKLALSAPGAGGVVGPIPGGAFAVWEGTSFATAFVSGAVALVRAQHPQWPCTEPTIALVEAILEGSSVDIDGLNPQHAGLLGAGRLDVAAATAAGPVARALGDLDGDGVIDGADLGLLIGQWGAACSGADLDGSGTVDGGDLGILLAAWTS